MWKKSHQISFDTLKYILTDQTTVANFNPQRECNLWVDASNYAIGEVLLQENDDGNDQPVSYISRPLTTAEQNIASQKRRP